MSSTGAREASPSFESMPAVRAGVHLDWIDALRGLAMVLLLLLHAGGAPEFKVGIPGPAWLGEFNALFHPFRMPTLMFVSGMLLAHSLAKPIRVYVLRKVQNLVWPYLIWTFILLNTAGWAYFVTYYLFSPLSWVAPGYLWYLWYLICYSGIALLIRRVPVWVTPLVCVVVALVFTHVHDIENMAYYATFFFAGHALNRYAGSILPVLRRNFVLIPLAVGGITLSVLSATVSGALSRELYMLPLNFAGILATIVILERHARWRVLGPLRWVGRNSIVYYTTHWPLMLLSSVLIASAGLDSWLTVGAVLAVFAIATPLAAVRHRRPWKWLFEAPGLGRWTSPRRPPVTRAGAPSSSVDEPGTMNGQPWRGPHT